MRRCSGLLTTTRTLRTDAMASFVDDSLPRPNPSGSHIDHCLGQPMSVLTWPKVPNKTTMTNI
eukprot:2351751-Pyramimonas_sp.AAC.1